MSSSIQMNIMLLLLLPPGTMEGGVSGDRYKRTCAACLFSHHLHSWHPRVLMIASWLLLESEISHVVSVFVVGPRVAMSRFMNSSNSSAMLDHCHFSVSCCHSQRPLLLEVRRHRNCTAAPLHLAATCIPQMCQAGMICTQSSCLEGTGPNECCQQQFTILAARSLIFVLS